MGAAGGYRSTVFYGWWIVGSIATISFLMGGASHSRTALFQPLVAEFAWSYLAISFASSLRMMETGMLAPAVGFLADRLGPRKVMFVGVFLMGLGEILLSRTASLAMFYVAALVAGMGSSATSSTVSMVAVANWFRRNAGKAMGLAAAGFGASGVMVPVLVWLMDSYGWRTALVVLGLGIWAIGIPLTLVIRHKPEPYGYLPDGDGHSPSVVAEPPVKQRDTQEGQPDPVSVDFSTREALRTRTFWVIAVAGTVQLTAVMVTLLHVMPYLQSLGLARPAAAMVATFLPLMSITGRLGFGWLADILHKRYLMAVLFAIQALGMLLFSLAHMWWLLVLFLLTFAPGWGGTATLISATQREYFGRNAFGGIRGLMMGVMTVGGIVGPALAGWVFDTTGSYRSVWLGLAALLAIAVPVILLGLRHPGQQRAGATVSGAPLRP